jgi:hypothetical protein
MVAVPAAAMQAAAPAAVWLALTREATKAVIRQAVAAAQLSAQLLRL